MIFLFKVKTSLLLHNFCNTFQRMWADICNENISMCSIILCFQIFYREYACLLIWAFLSKDPSVMQWVSRFISQMQANSSYDLHGWLWVEVAEELWDTSHDENAKNKKAMRLIKLIKFYKFYYLSYYFTEIFMFL